VTAFFDYPKAAAFGRTVPKSKIYGHAGASARIKQLFVDQVDQITWMFKLAPETINLAATKSVSEIQVFGVSLRSAEFSEDILAAIDKAIAFPIVFELTQNAKRKAVAAYKRPSEADSARWVVGEYFATDWEMESGPRTPLPTALNLGGLYDQVLTALMPAEAGRGGPLESRVRRMEALRAKQREIDRIRTRLNRENQFNKQVEINAELRDALRELNELSQSSKDDGL